MKHNLTFLLIFVFNTLNSQIPLPPVADFGYSINGYTVNFFSTSEYAETWEWDFGDGNTNTGDDEPTNFYDDSGDYIVTLTVTNEEGSDTHTEIITIGVEVEAKMNTTASVGCVPHTVTYTNTSINSDNVEWFFEGGSPSYSTEETVDVLYVDRGQYLTTLVASNQFSTDTATNQVTVDVPPIVDFEYEVDGLTVTARTTSEYAINHVWSHEGGEVLENFEDSIIMLYPDYGIYTLTLWGYNSCSGETVKKDIFVLYTAVNYLKEGEYFNAYPNPTDGFLIIDHNLEVQEMELLETPVVGVNVLILRLTDGRVLTRKIIIK